MPLSAPFYQVSGQDTEFLAEGFGEVAQVTEADLATSLFDAVLAREQEVFGPL